jgi:hypothetical protein
MKLDRAIGGDEAEHRSRGSHPIKPTRSASGYTKSASSRLCIEPVGPFRLLDNLPAPQNEGSASALE